jgi:hypothetical protein
MDASRAEQELAQAIDALRKCQEALTLVYLEQHSVERVSLVHRDEITDAVADAKRAAELVLALYAKRSIGTECAAVAKDVLLAGLGKI